MDSKGNTKGNNWGRNNQGGNNSGGNNPQIQGGISGPMTFGPGGNNYQGNTQIGGGVYNPQVQGAVNAGAGGNINLGLQGANFNSENQGNTHGNYSGGNNQGGNNSRGNNPQIQGGISGFVTFGPGGNFYDGNTQAGGGGNNPQIQGNIGTGTKGNTNLGLQGPNVWKSSKCWW